jgi:hypothetical protein
MAYHKLAVIVACIAIGPYSMQPAYAQSSYNPAGCYRSLGGLNLTREQAVDLCKKNGSLETAQCYRSLGGLNLTIAQAIELCKNGGTLETAQCYRSLGGLNLTKEQAILLCSKS